MAEARALKLRTKGDYINSDHRGSSAVARQQRPLFPTAFTVAFGTGELACRSPGANFP